MPRLRHSLAGHLRAMQMSATQLFVFVEGTQCDPYFFAELCSVTLNGKASYRISTAQEIPGHVGGKQSLLSFFAFLRGRRSLISDLAGKKTVCIFFLDKDVDDLRKRKKRSPHAIYTEYYDVQNYIFKHGNLAKGVASAASVDCQRLAPDFNDSERWCVSAAIRWRDWVALCIRLLEDGIRCEANYRVPSRVQTRPCGPTDPSALNALTNSIATRAGVPAADFRRRLAATAHKVDRYYRQGEHHRIFKGKWFALIAADDVHRIMTGTPYDGNGLSTRIGSSVAATLDFSAPWAEFLRSSLARIVAML